MKYSFAVAAVVAALACPTGLATAAEFYATPLNHGPPTNLPGDTIVPGLPQALVLVNGVTQPILQPILAPGAGPADPAVAPGHHHRFRHHAWRHHNRHVAKRGIRQRSA